MSSLPWQRQSGESLMAYEMFKVYLRLGPRRQMMLAFNRFHEKYQDRRRPSDPPCPFSLFTATSEKWWWKDRAAVWDLDMMQRYGKRFVVAYIRSLTRAMERAQEAIESSDVGDRAWNGALKALEILSEHFPEEPGRILAGDSPLRLGDRSVLQLPERPDPVPAGSPASGMDVGTDGERPEGTPESTLQSVSPHRPFDR